MGEAKRKEKIKMAQEENLKINSLKERLSNLYKNEALHYKKYEEFKESRIRNPLEGEQLVKYLNVIQNQIQAFEPIYQLERIADSLEIIANAFKDKEKEEKEEKNA